MHTLLPPCQPAEPRGRHRLGSVQRSLPQVRPPYRQSSGLSGNDADGVAQEVLVRVSSTIHDFEPRPAKGTFRTWLRKLVQWRAKDHQRRVARAPTLLDDEVADTDPEAEDPLESLPAAMPDPAAQFELASPRKIVLMALQRLQRRFSPATIQIYQHYVLEEWPIEKLIRILHTNRREIYMTKYRITPCLRREIDIIYSQMAARLRRWPEAPVRVGNVRRPPS